MGVSVPLSGLASVNCKNICNVVICLLVFVPLSGLASVNKSLLHLFLEGLEIVFVPLSGLASVNSRAMKMVRINDEFSSPYRG